MTSTALVDVAGHGGGALARLVVGVGVHGHHPQRAVGPTRSRSGCRRSGCSRGSTSDAAVLPGSSGGPCGCVRVGCTDRRRAHRRFRSQRCNTARGAAFPDGSPPSRTPPPATPDPLLTSTTMPARNSRGPGPFVERRDEPVAACYGEAAHGPQAGRVFPYSGSGAASGPGHRTHRVGLLDPRRTVGPRGTTGRWRSDDRGHAGDLADPGGLRPAQAELDELIANRPVIAAEINARREEGDLKENGGYHAAREEQGQQEARIRQLQELLRTAQVGTAPAGSGTASPGMVLTIHYEGDRRHRDRAARLPRGGRARRPAGRLARTRRWVRRCSAPGSARPASTGCPTAAA